MNPEEYIMKFGGKIGGHMYLKDIGGFDEFLPYAHILLPEDGFEKIAAHMRTEERFMRGKIGPYIVRGSHPNDHEGFVDALKTVGDVDTIDGLAKAIAEIRESANAPTVYDYSEYEGQPYDGKIRIMVAVQMQPRWAKRGSVIEHPHEKGTTIADVITP